MKPWHQRSFLNVSFIQHDNGQVTMRADLAAARSEGDQVTRWQILDERLDPDEVILKAKVHLTIALATWQHRNGVWAGDTIPQ